MKFEYIVLLVLVALMAYVTLRPTEVIVVDQDPVLYGDRYNYRIPPTWNYDWRGGPGRDRHRIMHERGPYNTRGSRGR
jgi:hypothetical protein